VFCIIIRKIWGHIWLIIYCITYTSRSRIFSLLWRRHRIAKFRPIYVRRSRSLSNEGSLMWPPAFRSTTFSRLLRHARGCWKPILTRILKGPHSVASYDTQGCHLKIVCSYKKRISFKSHWFPAMLSCIVII
jgi:hypothetical protein